MHRDEENWQDAHSLFKSGILGGKTDLYEGSRSKQNGKNVIKCGPGKVEDHLAMAVTGQVYEHEDAG